MSILMFATITGLENKAQKLKRSNIDKALDDCLQLILQSTQEGYVIRQSPDGKPWKENPQWYKDIKGQSSPLTGPTSRKIAGGELAGVYKLAGINYKRMKNSLMKSKGGMVGKVEYSPAAKERASMNQYGGKSEMEFIPISKSSPYQHSLIFNVEISERPHLGPATYPRIGDKTDAQWCEYYFGSVVDLQLSEDFE